MVVVRMRNVRGHDLSRKSIAAHMLQCNIEARPARGAVCAERRMAGFRARFIRATIARASITSSESDP